VDPFTVSVTIGRPREEVFEYLTDVANHPEFTDHFCVDWHMTRVETEGAGAGARFRVDAPLSRFSWADYTLTEVEPPHRIVQLGRGGKFNRIRQRGEWVLDPATGGTTRVEFTFETVPVYPSDRILEIVAGRGWYRRKYRRALNRLRNILEENRDRGRRATIAGR
jgi:uncharacterized protein YndB with AHSA1/START domain